MLIEESRMGGDWRDIVFQLAVYVRDLGGS